MFGVVFDEDDNGDDCLHLRDVDFVLHVDMFILTVVT